eukprot:11224201-Lingulodinium_polyedra.AAC.1
MESMFRRCNGSQTARSRTPRAHQNWNAHGVRERAVCEPLRQRNIYSTALLCDVSRPLHNDA